MKTILVMPRELTAYEKSQYEGRTHATIRKPDLSILKEAGELVPEDSHWLRRVKSGDVVLGVAKQADVVAPKKSFRGKE